MLKFQGKLPCFTPTQKRWGLRKCGFNIYIFYEALADGKTYILQWRTGTEHSPGSHLCYL